MRTLLLLSFLTLIFCGSRQTIVIKDQDAFFAGSVEEGQAILRQYNWRLIRIDSSRVEGNFSLRSQPKYVYIFYYDDRTGYGR